MIRNEPGVADSPRFTVHEGCWAIDVRPRAVFWFVFDQDVCRHVVVVPTRDEAEQLATHMNTYSP